MVLYKRILILEDNLLVLSKLLAKLAELEGDQPYDLSLTILTDYLQVENFINNNPKAEFDIILLDRDCKLNGSFHVLDVERFGVNKVIAISSVPKWNEELKLRGVIKVIEKDMSNTELFVKEVQKEVHAMLQKSSFI